MHIGIVKRWLLLTLLLSSCLGIVSAQATNARVIDMWNTLNVRQQPTRGAAVVAEVQGGTPINVIGRTRSIEWYRIQTPNGAVGWVAAGYVDLVDGTSPASFPVSTEGGTAGNNPPPQNDAPAQNTQNNPAPQPAQSVVATGDARGTVTASALNLRQSPSTNAQVITQIAGGTQVVVNGRIADSTWLQVVTPDGAGGWVASAFVNVDRAMSQLNVLNANAVVVSAPAQNNNQARSNDEPDSTGDTEFQTNPPPPAGGNAPYFALGANTWQIYGKGLSLGKNPRHFSKIGDSITQSTLMFRPFGYNAYVLGSYDYLQPTIAWFSTESFVRQSMAAQNGWTTESVLSFHYANQQLCQPGESPLQCEYRIHRPSVALIMLGTNDVSMVHSERYAQNLRTIVEFSMDEGVIPVLSTLPPRYGYDPAINFYNQLIRQTASNYGIPLWDYENLMRSLPNNGLSPDGVHPSEPPRGAADSANFTGGYLQYGYNARNLSALQVLDEIRRRVINP